MVPTNLIVKKNKKTFFICSASEDVAESENSKTVYFVVNLEEDQMICPNCLLSIANPSIYKSHGGLLLKALRVTDPAVVAVVAEERFPTQLFPHVSSAHSSFTDSTFLS